MKMLKCKLHHGIRFMYRGMSAQVEETDYLHPGQVINIQLYSQQPNFIIFYP